MPLKLSIYKNWENSRNNAILSLLEINPKAKIIDLGCGTGEFTLKVKEKIKSNLIIGVDIHDEALDKAKEWGIITKKSDLNNHLPFEGNSFDVVVTNQVIEHLLYPVRFIEEIFRTLTGGGYAIISTENLASWDNIVALLFGYTPFSMEFDSGVHIGNPFSPHDKELNSEYVYSHVRVFAWNGLVELAKFLNFKLEQIWGNGHLLGRFGEIVDKKHCRFVTVKLRKLEDEG